MKELKTPDVTPVQLSTVAAAIAGVGVAAGIHISRDLQDHIILLITVLAPVIIAADAHIRNGRSRPRIPETPAQAPQAQATAGTSTTAMSLPAALIPAAVSPEAKAGPDGTSVTVRPGDGTPVAVKPGEEVFVVRWVRETPPATGNGG